jgi:DNA-binding XRE family transcriptional regulator
MIKQEGQLAQASAQLKKVRQDIENLRERYTGLELELLATPMIQLAAEIQAEIRKYEELKGLDLEEAIGVALGAATPLGNIGRLLARLRIATGVTQSELASRLGWQQSNLSRFESETYHSQTTAKVVEYASALGVWLSVTPSLAERPRQGIVTTSIDIAQPVERPPRTPAPVA